VLNDHAEGLDLDAARRVLVVDDESTIRELVAEALRESGYVVETAPNGAAALEVIRGFVPHAIVLDLMMPRLDGVGFVQMLRLNPRVADVPVLLVTAAYAGYTAAEQVGARAFLSKPFELDRLVELVGELVGAQVPPPIPPPRTTEQGRHSPRRLAWEV
jgi:CheY-like chemotaxis protein